MITALTAGLKALKQHSNIKFPPGLQLQTAHLTVITVTRGESYKEAMQNQWFVTWMGLNPPFNYEARKQQETERKPMEKLTDQ